MLHLKRIHIFLFMISFLISAVIACTQPTTTPGGAASEATPATTTAARATTEAAPTNVEYTQADSLEVVSLMADASKKSTLDYARHFLGRPYVAYTLDGYYRDGARPEEEHLVVNLREFDCLTLLETCNALAMTRAQLDARPEGLSAWDAYCRNLESLRYFDGHADGYLSRIHYLSMSVSDHLKRGDMEEVSVPTKYTVPRTTVVNYMTQHPQSYFALKNNPELVEPLAAIERKYSGQKMRFLPQNNCGLSQQQLSMIHDGDLLYIVTNKAGLDYSHQGFAFWGKDGRLHMLHASSVKKRVIEDPLPLADYLRGIKSNDGVRILRLKL